MFSNQRYKRLKTNDFGEHDFGFLQIASDVEKKSRVDRQIPFES